MADYIYQLIVKYARLILFEREVAMHHREDGEVGYVGINDELLRVSTERYLFPALVSCIVWYMEVLLMYAMH
jgi:hypothetical protein